MEESRKEYQKNYYEKNKDELLKKQRVRNKKHYEDNKEHYAKRTRKWADDNKKRMRELQANYRGSSKSIEYRRNYYQQNKEKIAADTFRRTLKRKYNMSLEQFYKLEKIQNARCKICNKTANEVQTKGKVRLHVDHCHESNIVRGLLCHNCNAGLGLFKDDINSLKSAANYLEKAENDMATPTLFELEDLA